jgi:hypothetical protein
MTNAVISSGYTGIIRLTMYPVTELLPMPFAGVWKLLAKQQKMYLKN